MGVFGISHSVHYHDSAHFFMQVNLLIELAGVMIVYSR